MPLKRSADTSHSYVKGQQEMISYPSVKKRKPQYDVKRLTKDKIIQGFPATSYCE